jgi:hypothetical protein
MCHNHRKAGVSQRIFWPRAVCTSLIAEMARRAIDPVLIFSQRYPVERDADRENVRAIQRCIDRDELRAISLHLPQRHIEGPGPALGHPLLTGTVRLGTPRSDWGCLPRLRPAPQPGADRIAGASADVAERDNALSRHWRFHLPFCLPLSFFGEAGEKLRFERNAFFRGVMAAWFL